jgi:hypothetical protein
MDIESLRNTKVEDDKCTEGNISKYLVNLLGDKFLMKAYLLTGVGYK